VADGGFFDQFLGAGSLFEQLFLWGVISQVVGTAIGPELLAYTERVNAAHPEAVLAPGDLADAVIRNYMPMDAATAEAAKSGLDAARFATMVPLHGDAPGPQQLAQAVLRGIIGDQGTGPGSVSFEQGIREGRLADKWAPVLRALAAQVIPPADAAAAAVRNFLPVGEAAAQAAKSGVDGQLFATLMHLAGDAPGPQQLAEALRRGVIADTGTGPDSTSFAQGIAEGRLADKWTGVIRSLATIWPSPADALRAALTGQVPPDQGQALYERWGGDPQWYQVMLDTEGTAPTPLEAVQMALRGIIPWDGTGPQVTSYHQAFLEGPWRNKWLDAYRQAAYPVPTAAELGEYLRYGIIDKPTAAKGLAARGIVGDYATQAMDYAEAVSTFDFRGLTLSSVMGAFTANVITEANARQLLDSMHVSAKAADLVISYTKMQRAVSQVTSAISRVGTLYVTRKITADTARKSLSQLGLDSAAAAEIMQTWDLEASVNVKTLTETQVVDAWGKAILTDDEALGELVNIGYTPFDAWVLLSVKAGGPLPGRPPQGPPAVLPPVIPGST
jgi:hypothetical protein